MILNVVHHEMCVVALKLAGVVNKSGHGCKNFHHDDGRIQLSAACAAAIGSAFYC